MGDVKMFGEVKFNAALLGGKLEGPGRVFCVTGACYVHQLAFNLRLAAAAISGVDVAEARAGNVEFKAAVSKLFDAQVAVLWAFYDLCAKSGRSREELSTEFIEAMTAGKSLVSQDVTAKQVLHKHALATHLCGDDPSCEVCAAIRFFSEED